MTQPLNTKIVINADDDTGAAWASAAARAKAFGASVKALSGSAGLPRLAGAATNVGRALLGVADAARPVISGLTTITGIGLSAGLTGLVISLKQSANAIDDMAKKARQLGLSTQQLRRFSYIAEKQDLTWESASAGLTKAVKAYDEIRTGVGRASAVLKKIEPVLSSQIKGAKSSGEAINIMVSAIHQAIKVGNKARALKLASIFFGDEDFTKIAELSKAEIAAMNKRSDLLQGILPKDAGAQMDEFNDSLTDIQFSIRGLSEAAAVELLPQLTDMNLALADWIASNRESDDAMTKTAKGMRGLTPKVGVIERMSRAFKRLKEYASGIEWDYVGSKMLAFGQGLNKVAQFVGGWDNVLIGLALLPLAGMALNVINLGKAFIALGDAISMTLLGRLSVLALAVYAGYQNWEKLAPIVERVSTAIKSLDLSGFIKSLVDFDREYTAGFKKMLGIPEDAKNYAAEYGAKLGAGLREGLAKIDLFDAGAKMLTRFWEGILSVKDKIIAGMLDIGEAMAKALTAPETVKPLKTLPYSAPPLGDILNNLDPGRASSDHGAWPRRGATMPSETVKPTPKALNAPIIIPESLRKSLQMPSAPRQPSGFGGASGSNELGGSAGADLLGIVSRLDGIGSKQARIAADAVRESGDRSAAGSFAVAGSVRSLSTAVQQLAAWLARMQDMGGTGGATGSSGEGFGAGGGVGSAGYGEPGGGGPGSRMKAAMGAMGGGTDVPAPGAQGQFRPVYKITAPDISAAVVNTVAGEARMSNKAGIDAVINTMFNRLGSKAYGPSGNLAQVARAPNQFAGWRNATKEQAAYIRERIKAIASGAVPDNTKGANEFRGDYYNGPWMQRMGRPYGTDIGGNIFARNPAGGVSPYAAYSDEELARRNATKPKKPLADVVAQTKSPYAMASDGQPSGGPAARQTPRPAPAPASVAQSTVKHELGAGSLAVTIKPQGAEVTSVKMQQPENITVSAGVDKTGSRTWRHGGAVP